LTLAPDPSPGAPHPRFPVKFRRFRELHAPFLKERRTRGPVQSCVQEIRGISLVFREMWDSTALTPKLFTTLNSLRGTFVSPTSREKRARYGAPGFVAGMEFPAGTPRSQKRDLGHPLKVWQLQLLLPGAIWLVVSKSMTGETPYPSDR
jgi:hypothetical protein